MKVYLDEVGYPNEIFFSKYEKEQFASGNFYSISSLYHKMKIVVEYWEELKDSHESRQYGDLDEQEYYNRMVMLQKKYFADRYVEEYKRIQL